MKLSYLGFLKHIFSKQNIVYNYDKIKNMDSMDFPLTHYFINSSNSPYESSINI